MADGSDATLDPEQVDCVTSPTDIPLLIQAGAGSGKTRTLLHRICFLLKSGVRPWQILGITFTRRSAEALRARVSDALPPEAKFAAAQLRLKTIHSFSLELLRTFGAGKSLGGIVLPENFTVCGAKQQRKICRNVVQLHSRTRKDSETVDQLMVLVNKTKTRVNDVIMPFDQFTGGSVAYLYENYEQQLHEVEQAIDFGDILSMCFKLLKSFPEVLAFAQQRASHVLVDEFQDLNEVQFEIVCLLVGASGRVTCVGDENQSIYAWRGALPGIFTTFKSRFPNTVVKSLKTNYRSTIPIVASASSVVTASQVAFNTNPSADPVSIFPLASIDHGLWCIAQTIKRLCCDPPSGDSLPPVPPLRLCDCAVLSRTKKFAKIARDALRNEGIVVASRNATSTDVLRRDCVECAFSFLSLVDNPGNDHALSVILEKCCRGVGTAFRSALEQAHAHLANEGMSRFAVLSRCMMADGLLMHNGAELMRLRKPQKEAVRKIVDVVLTARHQLNSNGSSLEDILRYVFTASGLEEFVRNDALKGNSSRKKNRVRLTDSSTGSDSSDCGECDSLDDGEGNIATVTSAPTATRVRLLPCEQLPPFRPFFDLAAESFTSSSLSTTALRLRCLLDELSNLAESDDFGSMRANSIRRGTATTQSAQAPLQSKQLPMTMTSRDTGVFVSTVHQAKGLEWPVVFVYPFNEAQFPLLYGGKLRRGEETRIAYVALSRAMHELYLVYSTFDAVPSRFLSSLPQEFTITHNAAAAPITTVKQEHN